MEGRELKRDRVRKKSGGMEENNVRRKRKGKKKG